MTTFADDFNRADSSSLGAGWSEVSGDWSIVGNQLSAGNAGGVILLRPTTAAATDDNFAQITIASTTAASQGIGCRGDATFQNGYLWRNNGTSWDLFSVVGGAFTSIATYAAAAAPGDVVKVQAVGTAVKAYVNGVERASVTSTDVATGKNAFVRSESVSGLRYDDFSSGDVGGGGVVTGSIDQAYGGLGGGITAVREVQAAVAQAYGGLGGSIAGLRDTAGAIAFAGGPLSGGMTAASAAAGTADPTTTQVVIAWLRQYAGYPASATTVPKPDSWMSSPGYFVRVAGVVGGGAGLDVPDHGPVVQVEVVAALRAAAGAKSTSRLVPRGVAESQMTQICRRTYTSPAGLDLTLPNPMRPVWIETIYPVSEVRELPDPQANFARYSADIYVGWIERNPVG